MPNTTSDALTRAIEALGLIGHTSCRHGHPFDAENTYEYERKDGRKRRACKACQALHTLGVTIKEGRYYAKNGSALPLWWSPDARFAWRLVGDPTDTRYETKQDALADLRGIGAIGATIERITADLTTGEEVPA